MMCVEFAQTFGQRLETIEEFMLEQDVGSAVSRIEELRDQIFRFAALVAIHPQIGRPTSILDAQSAEGRIRLQKVLRRATEAGLTHLREYVLRSHVVLYAHSDPPVVLLSIRHQRELGYIPEVG